MANTLQFNDENFKKEVLESDKPVLVDFWAQWCGPCKIIGPVVEELAEEYEGKVKIGKCNTEKSPDSMAQYGITSIPALLIFKDGKPVDMVIGAVSKDAIVEKLEKVI
ncbi:MAG: thioredoxin [bacterium]